MNPAAAAIEKARARREAGQADPTDMERILSLPSVPDLSALPDGGRALVDRWTRRLRRSPDAPPLRPLQAFALDAAAKQAARGGAYGVLGGIGVGHGKTLLSFLLGEVFSTQRTLLLIPSAMQAQAARDLAAWRQWYSFRVPTIMPYSELSVAKASSFLSYHRPDLIISDECQALRHQTSARTKRVIRYMLEHPTTVFCAFSGTLTSKALKDYSHLAELALREGTPLPMADDTLEAWESVLNADGEPGAKELDAFWPLVRRHATHTGRGDWREHRSSDRQVTARVAFRRRLATTPGVVTSTDASAACTLYMAPRAVDVPDVVTEALENLEATWCTPGGEELSDATALARAAAQISAGFYYVWDWPAGKRDETWLEARAAWHKAVRNTLRGGARDGYDSPLLVAQAADRGHGSAQVLAAWGAWKLQKHKKPPPVRVVWVDPFLADDAVTWAKENGPCLLWYYSRAMEAALAERGIPVFGQGTDAPDHAKTPVAACSISVHGKGKNLQQWSRMLVVEPPSAGAVWEQLIGRIHRQGQRADSVAVLVHQQTHRQTGAVETAKRDAAYIQDTQGTAQRLCFAVWTDEKALKVDAG